MTDVWCYLRLQKARFSLSHSFSACLDGPSAYNDNKGLKATICFTPLLDPKKKRRANAKAPTVNYSMSFHEEFAFRDWLVKVVTTIGRQDLLQGSCLYKEVECDDTDSFILSYTVPRKVSDAIVLQNEEHFQELVETVCQMGKDNWCKINVIEQKTSDESDPEDEDEESEDEGRRRKKRKGNELSVEEEEQREIIKNLEAQYKCNDKECPFSHCYLAGPEATHIHLTHQHKLFWAAGIVSPVDSQVCDRYTYPL
ncbi:hypothetical protein BKA70DRAFT_1132100 [Coprinopsis sp. MPI-PUGE-AT-0042]|nr:hypothetical protein BKA70DRAFT_1132100 [Coprinopsis sp. MPI-PUGE-AT-0042]